MIELTGEHLLAKAELEFLTQAMDKLMANFPVKQAYLSVALVDDEQMQALNLQWRGKDAPTDVLSFSAQEGERMPGTEDMLGDIVISVDTAQRQALELGHSFEEELAVLLVHGSCHLLGFDHERSQDEAKAQIDQEMALLDRIGINPSLALVSRGSV